MALTTYRFRFDNPGLNLDQLEDDVGTPTAVVSRTGGLIVDVTAESAFEEDVISSLEEKGFTFVSSNPVIDTERQFKQDNNIVGLELAIFKTDGGLIYNSNGHPLVKKNP